MKGGSAPRRKGDNFERRVKKYLISKSFFCIRQPRSAFPDLVAVRKVARTPELFFIECKVCKYISKEEKSNLKELEDKFAGRSLVAYKGPGKELKFCDLDYKEIIETFK